MGKKQGEMDESQDTVRVNISLPIPLHKKHVKLAFDKSLSFSAWVRLALIDADNESQSLPLKGPVLPFTDNG